MNDFEEMYNQTINLYRKLDMKHQLIWKNKDHLMSVLISLDIHLGELATVCGLDYTKINGYSSSTKSERLEKLVVVIRDFLLISIICNWANNLVLSDKEINRLQMLKSDNKEQLMKLYLSMKNMLLKSYYQNDENAFQHAFILLVKWAKIDLHYDNLEIKQAFQQKIEKDLKLI